MPYDLKPGGIEFKRDLTFEEGQVLFNTLAMIGKNYQWWVGDFCNYCEAHFGDKYSQLVDATQIDYGVARNCAWVAKEFPNIKDRKIDFSHCREVIRLATEDRTKFLDRAERESMSVRELRQIVVHAVAPVSPHASPFEEFFEAYATKAKFDAAQRIELADHLEAAFKAGRDYERDHGSVS